MKTLLVLMILAAAVVIFIVNGGPFDPAQGGRFLRQNNAVEVAQNIAVTVPDYGKKNVSDVQRMAQPKKKPIKMVFVGDIMLSRSVGKIIDANKDPRYPFLEVMEKVSKADIAFANLEGPVSGIGKNQGSIYSFRANPAVLTGLIYVGFDVLSLANNHILDWGPDALTDTVNILHSGNIKTIGAGTDADYANAPAVIDVGGMSVAFLGYTNLMPRSFEAGTSMPGLSSFHLEQAQEIVKNLKQKGNLVVVSFHWGVEYEKSANNAQKNIAHALVDAGADLIIGHHPHVVQEMEHYKNGYIAYSLGNFVFDQSFSEDTMRGLMLEVEVKNGVISDIKQVGVEISKTFQPYLP